MSGAYLNHSAFKGSVPFLRPPAASRAAVHDDIWLLASFISHGAEAFLTSVRDRGTSDWASFE